MAGVIALVAVSFCLSLMFPTIYGVALKGLGPATKFGAAGLVMAIVGGAIMPLVQGALVDSTSPAFSFIVPAVCFVGRRPLRALRPAGRAERERRRARPSRSGASGRRSPRAVRHDRPARSPRPSRRSRWRSARAATTRRRAPRRTRSSSRSCPGGPRGPRRPRSTPSSPRSGRPTRASTPSTPRSPAAPARKAIVELAKRLQDDDPPDVWQTFAGKSVQGYAEPRRGPQTSRRSSSASDLRARMQPDDPAVAVMRDGRPYGVPTGAHRSNVLWFNTRLLERAGVTPPSSGYTLAAFLADLEKVKASGGDAAVPRRQGPRSPPSSCSRTRC